MAKINNLTEEFLNALNEIEVLLFSLLFSRHSFFEKGLAYFVEYKKESNTKVEFLFGPSDWGIEMIIYTSNGKYAGKDLLQIPEILKWVNDNKYKQENGRNLKNELIWFVELLKISLPHVE
jgi:hypothetical protein